MLCRVGAFDMAHLGFFSNLSPAMQDSKNHFFQMKMHIHRPLSDFFSAMHLSCFYKTFQNMFFYLSKLFEHSKLFSKRTSTS